MSGGSTKTKSKQSAMLDPNSYQALYGTGATQPIFNKKGELSNPGTAGTGGIIPSAQGLYASNPTGLNNTQTSALQAGVDYLTSPQSLQGATAANQVANTFLGQLSNANSTPAPSGLNGSAPVDINSILNRYGGNSPVDFNAIREGFGSDLAALKGQLPGGVAPPSPITGGSVGGLGINYRDAAERALSGQVDNPYLQEMAGNAADVATQNYLRQIAPAMRAGARQTGMYGSSRQGIAEGIAQSDLNDQVGRWSTDLFGGAYENAQSRAAQMAAQAMGYDAQAQIANAQMQQQAQMLNAQLAQQAGLANQSAQLQGLGLLANYDLGSKGLGMDAAQLAATYDLGSKGLGMDAARLATGYDTSLRGLGLEGARLDLGNRQLTSDNAVRGAELAQIGAQIPFQNIQGLYGFGSTLQQAPWQQLGNLADVIYPTTGYGQTQLGSTTEQNKLGSGQIIGGLASLGIGAMTGGMGGGLLAGLGGAASANPRGFWGDNGSYWLPGTA